MNSAEFYSEGCNFIRHYSNSSQTVRIVALVQGLVVLSAWAYALLKDTQKPEYLVLVSAFGLAFTGLLYLLHSGYLIAAREYTAAVIAIENDPKGPVTFYEEKRKKLYNTRLKRLVTIHATFSLIGFAFPLCLLFSIVKWISILTYRS